MKNIVILGCENSHADTFLKFIKNNEEYGYINVVGVYSDDPAAMEKLNEKYGVPKMNSFGDAAGSVDGVIITARHGDNHYKYAAPYIPYGVPMFIDKPITVSEAEAVRFMRECRAAGVRITGGSSCIHDEFVQKLKAAHENSEGGETLGGMVRSPVSIKNDYGGFFFYSQHLVEVMLEIFGRYPKSVSAYENGKKITVVFRYESFDTVGLFTDGIYTYYAMRASHDGDDGSDFVVNGASPCFKIEFDNFCDLLSGGGQKISYDDFISPVFVMNAIKRSLDHGREEAVRYEKV